MLLKGVVTGSMGVGLRGPKTTGCFRTWMSPHITVTSYHNHRNFVISYNPILDGKDYK